MTKNKSDTPLGGSSYLAGQSDVRPWGRWKVVATGERFALKTIDVIPGQRLSLQFHNYRSEHWVVVAGNGVVTVGGDTMTVEPGSHVYIPRETRHRIANTGEDDLVFVEVQVGDRLEEMDIVRIQDDYKRDE